MTDRHLVIDGSNLLHRVLHVPALRDLCLKDGTHSGGVYGFLRCLRSAITEVRSGIAVVVWDAGHSVRRQELFSSYKSPAPPLPLSPQTAPLLSDYLGEYLRQRSIVDQLCPLLGVRTCRLRGREADDIIYQIAARIHEGDVMIVSEDRDYYQMLSNRVSLFRPIAEEVWTPESFQQEYGFAPDRWVQYRALTGDGADSIPGIKGVGDKTARLIIQNSTDIGSMFHYCEQSPTTRIQKVTHRFDIVLRNIALMDLRLEEFTEEETNEIERQVWCEKPLYRQPEFFEVARMLEFESILERFSLWMDPFKTLR